MSDRNLRDPNRGYEQTLKLLAAQVRALNKRAWQGALRSIAPDDSSGIFIDPTTIATIDVSAGRWAVDGLAIAQATLVAPHVFHVDIILTGITTSDDLTASLTGGPVDGEVPGTGDVKLPLPIFGDFSSDEPTRVTLRAWGSTALDTTWAGIRLRLAPY